MSQIKAELSKAADVSQKRGEDENDFLKRLIKSTSDLDDKAWNKLSAEAQNWFNDAADAVNTKKEIPSFPDVKPAASESASNVEVGDVVSITTKRGKNSKGKVVEVDDEVIVLDVDGEQVELDRSRIDKIEKEVKEEKTTRRRSADSKAEPKEETLPEPKVGDTVEGETKRGKEFSGKVVEVEQGLIVIDDGKGEVEIEVEKIKSMKVTSAKEESGRRRGAASEPPEKEESKGKRVTAAANGGISVTQRMRELIIENIDAKKDEIAKLLDKEKLQYKPATLDLVYADSYKLIDLLKSKKRLK